MQGLPGYSSSVYSSSLNKLNKLHNFQKVKHAVEQWISSTNTPPLELYIHSDAGTSPPLATQLSTFSKAAIIIAPHGAALVLSIASVPTTLVVEFIDVDTNQINVCYARLSTILGLEYYGVPMIRGVGDVAGMIGVLEKKKNRRTR